MKLYLFNPSLDCGAGIYSLPDQLLQGSWLPLKEEKLNKSNKVAGVFNEKWHTVDIYIFLNSFPFICCSSWLGNFQVGFCKKK